jgi:hypothetical protein
MFNEQPTNPGMLDRNQSVSVEKEVLKRISNSVIFKHVLELPQSY